MGVAETAKLHALRDVPGWSGLSSAGSVGTAGTEQANVWILSFPRSEVIVTE